MRAVRWTVEQTVGGEYGLFNDDAEEDTLDSLAIGLACGPDPRVNLANAKLWAAAPALRDALAAIVDINDNSGGNLMDMDAPSGASQELQDALAAARQALKLAEEPSLYRCQLNADHDVEGLSDKPGDCPVCGVAKEKV